MNMFYFAMPKLVNNIEIRLITKVIGIIVPGETSVVLHVTNRRIKKSYGFADRDPPENLID